MTRKESSSSRMDGCLRIYTGGKVAGLTLGTGRANSDDINFHFWVNHPQPHLRATKSQIMESFNLAQTYLGRKLRSPSPLTVSDKSHSSAPQCRGAASEKSVLKYRGGRDGNIQEEKTQHTCHSAIIGKTNLPLNAAIK